MRDQPLFRAGKAILKARSEPDGTVTLYKPFSVKAEHLMRMTGAPGWDKAYVDQVFEPGVRGTLRWHNDAVEYDIDIDTFRERAFIKDVGVHGAQYHCNIGHYNATGVKVKPTKNPERNGPLVFGELLPCARCKGKGKNCTLCEGRGYVPWKSSSSAT